MLGERPTTLFEIPDCDEDAQPVCASERTTQEIFRGFTAEDVAKSYTNSLRQRRSILQNGVATSIDSHSFFDQVRQNYPSVYSIICLVGLPYEASLIRSHKDKFYQLLNTRDISHHQLVATFKGLLHMSSKSLKSLIALSFTPQEIRDEQSLYGDLSNLDLTKRVPDLTVQRLDPHAAYQKVTEMLTLTHIDALRKIRMQYSAEQISTEPPSVSEKTESEHLKAGFFHATNTYYGLLVDAANGGKQSALKFQPEKEGTPATELEMCPGAPFVSRHFQGVGMALSQNMKRVLEVMR